MPDNNSRVGATDHRSWTSAVSVQTRRFIAKRPGRLGRRAAGLGGSPDTVIEDVAGLDTRWHAAGHLSAAE